MSDPFADRPRKPVSFPAYAVVNQSGAANAVRLGPRDAAGLALGADGLCVVRGRFVPDEDAAPERPAP